MNDEDKLRLRYRLEELKALATIARWAYQDVPSDSRKVAPPADVADAITGMEKRIQAAEEKGARDIAGPLTDAELLDRAVKLLRRTEWWESEEGTFCLACKRLQFDRYRDGIFGHSADCEFVAVLKAYDERLAERR